MGFDDGRGAALRCGCYALEALVVLRGLIERVVLHPADRGFEIALVGEIAALVDLGALGKAAGDVGTLPFIDIDARPLTSHLDEPSCDAQPEHTSLRRRSRHRARKQKNERLVGEFVGGGPADRGVREGFP